MKIRRLIFLTIIAALLGVATACNDHDTQASDTYTVRFEANGGSPAPQNQTISHGGKVTEPPAMIKTGFNFGGWYKEAALNNQWDFDNDTVTANITLYASWYNYDTVYTVRFEANGGSPVPQSQTVRYEGYVTEPAAMTNAGYGFDGWYKEADCINQWYFYYQVTANITLYAKWVLPRVVTDEIEGGNLVEKFQWIYSNAESHSIYILELSGNESLGPQNLFFSGEKNNIAIQLIGIGGVRTIDLYGSGSLFTIENNVTLSLNENIVLIGASNYDTLVSVKGGNLIMNNGSKINGSVYVGSYYYNNNDTGGIFTMNGGEISGNDVSSSYYGNSGVYVDYGGTFTMNSGKISGNNSSGVYVAGNNYNDTGGTFTMTGGEISGNTDGGVYVSGTFTMTGGKISGNTSSYGGGVCIYEGTFTMTGGEISGNTSSYGGGVFVGSASRFEKTGGIITGYSSDTVNGNAAKDYDGNILDNSGHAVYVDHDDSRFIRRKETTAGQGDNLRYIRNEPNPPTISGAWDN
jgi:uncharacterized repeat protein (TIGR02543 family)